MGIPLCYWRQKEQAALSINTISFKERFPKTLKKK